LLDHQWFVRLRTVQAIALLRQPADPLHLDIRECLRDAHWRVREAAVQTLISLGREGKQQLYEHFLTSDDATTRELIVQVIERTGLMSELVEAYSQGTGGVDALMVEQLASDAAPLGLSGILRTLNPDVRARFLDRFLPYAEAKMRFMGEMQPAADGPMNPQQVLDFPPAVLA
jgi:HEAT repeat protein